MNLPENIAAAIRESGGDPDSFRIETQCGRNIVCGGLLPLSCLKVGQEWQGSGGGVVTIDRIEKRMTHEENPRPFYQIHYSSAVQKSHDELDFDFQCRYCLVVD